MSYDERDAALDEMYERISEQAISEFTSDRLRSYYLSNPMVMRPAVDALQEAQKLKANGHHTAAVVFCSTAIELFLKATVLQPVVHGLVHSSGLADVIVKYAVGQTGFDRYRDLLSRLFNELASIELPKVARDGTKHALIDECRTVQELRNDIIHKGASCEPDAAEKSIDIVVAVYQKIVCPMLGALGLIVGHKGRIERTPSLSSLRKGKPHDGNQDD
jgi:HEPN domain-containing protein